MQMFYYLIQFVTLNLIVIPLTGNLLCLTLIQIFVEATYLKKINYSENIVPKHFEYLEVIRKVYPC